MDATGNEHPVFVSNNAKDFMTGAYVLLFCDDTKD